MNITPGYGLPGKDLKALADLPLNIPPGSGLRVVTDYKHLDSLFGYLLVWERPRKDQLYVLSADVSGGTGRDRTVADITRVATESEPDEQVAQWVSPFIDPVEFASVLYVMGGFYSGADGQKAVCAIELGGYGLATQSELIRHYGYDNLYIWQYEDKLDPERRMSNSVGWDTNRRSRPLMLARYIRRVKSLGPDGLPDLYRVNSPFTLDEMKTFKRSVGEEDADAAADSTNPHAHDDCIPGESLVQTARGMVRIDEIQVGDLALTHTGNYRKVLRVGKRLTTHLYEIKALGRPPIRLTGNHKLLLCRRYRPNGTRPPLVHGDPEWWASDDLTTSLSDYATTTPIARALLPEGSTHVDLAEYAPASNYKVENGVLVAYTYKGARKNPKQNKVKRWLTLSDPDFCRVLGYYVAEGSCGAHSISFASHVRELPFRRWLASTLLKHGLHPCTVKSSNGGRVLGAGSVPFRNFFRTLGSRTEKHLPFGAELYPQAAAAQILVGYLAGDASFIDGAIRAATISPTLAYQLQQISLRCGWPVSIMKTPGQNGYKPQWHLSWNGPCVEEIKRLFPRSWLKAKRATRMNRKADQTGLRLHAGYMVGKIQKAEKQPWQGWVYNLEVDQDHSYVVEGTVVHNCIMAGAIGVYVAQTMYFEVNEPLDARRRRLTEEKLRLAAKEQAATSEISYHNQDYTLEEMEDAWLDKSRGLLGVDGELRLGSD